VVHELLNNSKLNPRRFAAEGHGSAKPIAPNNNQENRALNRRVEMTIVQGKDYISEISQAEISAQALAPTVDVADSPEQITETVDTTIEAPEKTALIEEDSEKAEEEEIVEDDVELADETSENDKEAKAEEKIDKQEEAPIEATEFKSRFELIKDGMKGN